MFFQACTMRVLSSYTYHPLCVRAGVVLCKVKIIPNIKGKRHQVGLKNIWQMLNLVKMLFAISLSCACLPNTFSHYHRAATKKHELDEVCIKPACIYNQNRCHISIQFGRFQVPSIWLLVFGHKES